MFALPSVVPDDTVTVVPLTLAVATAEFDVPTLKPPPLVFPVTVNVFVSG